MKETCLQFLIPVMNKKLIESTSFCFFTFLTVTVNLSTTGTCEEAGRREEGKGHL